MPNDPPSASQRRRRRERRSLTGLVCGLGLFVLASAILYLLLHTSLSFWRDSFFARRLACLKRRTSAAERHFTVVILGSSRSHYGVRASALEQMLNGRRSTSAVAFNLAKPGAGPVMVLYTWQRMCREGIRPDLLLLEVSSFQLAEGSARSDTTEAALPATTLSQADLPFIEMYAPSRLSDLREDWLIEKATPWLGYRSVLLGSLVPRLLPASLRSQPIKMCNDSGDGIDWFSPGTSEARRLATQRTVESLAGSFAEEVPGDRPAQALRQLLAEARQRGIRVVLVLPPEAGVLRQAFPLLKVRQAERFIDGLVREYGAEVVDARGWLNREDDLADGVHATPAGAARFTERLSREVVLPRLAASR
jgi:hypothetical protein